MFNVKEYGAVADGVALDSRAIQRAIDACAAVGGGTVYIPEGKYLCGTRSVYCSSKPCIKAQRRS